MENDNPSFKFTPVVVPPSKATSPGASADNWVSCDTLAERWGCSPFDVIDVLEKQGLRFRRSFGDGVPDIHHLQEAQVHVVDLRRWEHENTTPQTQCEKESRLLCGLLIDKMDGDLMPREEAIALRDELHKLQAENRDLRAENEKLHARTEVQGDTAAEQLASPASHRKRTSAASEKVNALNLQKWRELYLPGLIKIAVFCGEDGKKPRCRSDIKAISKKLGLQLSDAALEELRSALPDAHKTNKPGAPRQG